MSEPKWLLMKLSIVTETFPPEVNGVAMTFGVIAREMALRGHEVTIYRPFRDKLSSGSEKDPYTVKTMPGFPIPGYGLIRMGYPAKGRLKKDWQNNRPDLVHVVTEGPLGASAIDAALDLKIPVSSSFHTNFHAYTSSYGLSPAKRIALAWLRRVHNKTLRTFAPTQELCDELKASGFNNLAILSRGVDLRGFSASRRSLKQRVAWGASAENPVVLHVGRMAPEKNYTLLFKAYETMLSANPRLRFVLAGEGPLQAKLQKQHPECIFAGFLSRDEIGKLYASADIYIHASSTETFGNVLTEAMASGLAVSGFNYAAARQFIRHGENGLVSPLGDEQAFIANAVRLASEASLREKVRTAAPASLSDQSWAKVIARFEAELLQLSGLEVAA